MLLVVFTSCMTLPELAENTLSHKTCSSYIFQQRQVVERFSRRGISAEEIFSISHYYLQSPSMEKRKWKINDDHCGRHPLCLFSCSPFNFGVFNFEKTFIKLIRSDQTEGNHTIYKKVEDMTGQHFHLSDWDNQEIVRQRRRRGLTSDHGR